MTLSTQFITMLTMVFAGILSVGSFDTYKRLLRPHVYWQQYAIDILFFLTMGSVVYYLLFLANGGILRFYLVIAFLLGVSAYYALFQNAFLKGLEVTIRVLVNLYNFITNLVNLLLVKPILWILILSFSIIVAIGRFLLKLLQLLIKVLFAIISPFIPRIVKKYLNSFVHTCDNEIRRWWKILRSWWENRRKTSVEKKGNEDE
ncbi:spore cortex biosynthesis protein YabQ [Alkalibacillus haloalkaliphilus]|uniref:spore cortex biosynthesis protein YabQ n=1 Tax=Alkalibacillus haloalkaliphilus TaxID=94136 RepID=UPI00030CD7EB|nr:spore cortex biosynthesis protein YabQ [Alkalibacillus haloalkaliphilus]